MRKNSDWGVKVVYLKYHIQKLLGDKSNQGGKRHLQGKLSNNKVVELLCLLCQRNNIVEVNNSAESSLYSPCNTNKCFNDMLHRTRDSHTKIFVEI